MAFSSFGVDTNVFNEPTVRGNATQRLNLIPQTVVTLDAGRLRGGALAQGSYLYFDKYSDQRSLSGVIQRASGALVGAHHAMDETAAWTEAAAAEPLKSTYGRAS